MSMQSEKENIVQSLDSKKSRRGFILKAAAVAPLIATVSSRPVWATDITSISGNLSGNLSNHTYEEKLYDGCSPGFWHKPSRYPVSAHGYTINFNTAFNSIFKITTGPNIYTAPFTAGFTTIIDGSTNPATQVERFAAASFMNSLADPSYPYTPEIIIDFYGYYHREEINYAEAKSVLENLIHNGTSSGSNPVC